MEGAYSARTRALHREVERGAKLIDAARRYAHVDSLEALEDAINEIMRDPFAEDVQSRSERVYDVASVGDFREFLRKHAPERLADWERERGGTRSEGEADE